MTTDQGVISPVADRANCTAAYNETMAVQADVCAGMAMVSEK